MAWIESHQTLRNHRKTRRLARRLNVSVVTAVGHLHFLWWWCLDYTADGLIDAADVPDLAEAGGWEGEPATFVDALVEAGFLEQTDSGGMIVHDWHDYAGKLIDQRQRNAERQRAYRQRQRDERNGDVTRNVTRDVTVTSPLRDTSRNREPYRTVPNQTVPNRTEDSSPPTPPVAQGGRAGKPSWVETHPLFGPLVAIPEIGRPGPRQWSAYGEAIKELEAKDVTPEDVPKMAAIWPSTWANRDGKIIALTLQAFIKHSALLKTRSSATGGRQNGRHRANDPADEATLEAFRQQYHAGSG